MFKSETCLERPQISKMERFATIFNGFCSLTIVAKVYFLDVCRSLGYVWVSFRSKSKKIRLFISK